MKSVGPFLLRMGDSLSAAWFSSHRFVEAQGLTIQAVLLAS
jgi:hypothetical protein